MFSEKRGGNMFIKTRKQTLSFHANTNTGLNIKNTHSQNIINKYLE